MLRLHDHHVEPSLLAKFNKQRGNTVKGPASGALLPSESFTITVKPGGVIVR